MIENDTTYNIRISSKSDRNPVTRYDETLTRSGFTFYERKTAHSSFYELNNATNRERGIWIDWAKKYHLECHVVEMKYTRSADYRGDYFKNNTPTVAARYRCVYCGKKLKYKDVTIDHLYPVNKMMYRQTTRDAAKVFGIDGVNDPKNLVAACRKCNSKKGTKMGVWILRGMIGRHEGFWMMRNALVISLILFGVYYLYMNGYIELPTPKPFSVFVKTW